MRKLYGVLAAAALVGGLVVAVPASPAMANSPGLPFSADALPTWQTNGIVWDLAASHGKIVAVGDFGQIRPGNGQSGSTQNLRGVAIFDAATGQPDSCQLPASLSGGTARLWAAEAAPDGETVFIGGNFSSIAGVTISRLAEIDVETCQVTSFRAGAISSFVREVKVTDDAVFFGGTFKTVAGQERLGFAKVNRSGQLLPWVANATGNTPDNYSPTVDPNDTSRGESLVVSPDGTKVALGGGYFWINGVASHSVTVVDAITGEVIRAYPGFVQNTSRTQALVTDGVNFYGGNEGSAAFDGTYAINWETLDEVWRDTCLGAVQDLEVHQGLLFHAHHNHDCASMGMFPDGRRIYLSVTHTDDPTQHHIGWFPELNDGIGEHLGPRALEVAPGNNGNTYFWVGGEFTRVNGTNQQSLTRFGPQDTGNPPVPSIGVRAITPNAIQVNIRGVNDRDDDDITYAVYRGNNTTTPIWTGVATSHWWYRPQITFVDTDVTPGTNYSYRVRAIDGAGNQSGLSAAANVTASATGSEYATAVINDSPRLYYRYDDIGTWVIDSAGQTVAGLNGIAENGVGHVGGGIGGGSAASFTDQTGQDPQNQYIWNDQIAHGPTQYTIETWFNTTSTTGGALVNYGNGRPRTDSGEDVISNSYTIGGTPLGFQSNAFDRVVYMEAQTGRIRFGVRAPNQVQTLRSPGSYNDGQWHHVVATQGPLGMRLYIDGALVGQNTVTQNRTYYGVWHVGGDNLNGFPNNGGNNNNVSRFFDGLIDETAVYYYPLDGPQVIAHYIAGGGTPGAGDTTAPSVPTNLTRTGNPAVNLSWSSSTDNVGVAGYRVYRGTTPTVETTPDNRVAEVTTTSWSDPAPQAGTRYYRVTAVDAAGNESQGSTAVEVTITDSTPPSVPGNVAASSLGSTVTVTWNASTDNNEVDHYVVFRGTNPGFVADGSSQVDTSGTTQFQESGVTPGTWYYKVAAVDTAGNTSAASDPAEVLVTLELQEVTVEVAVVEDTMVAQNNANFVYGATAQLSSRGQNGSNLESYLRFALPSLPAGATLTGATLRVVTSTDPTATTAGAHQIRLLTGSWSEASTTWNNRSVTLGNQIGELANAPALNTPYVFVLDAAQLVAFLGGDLNIAMVSGSTDNLRIYSKDFAVASSWPVLTLTYTVPV